MRTLVAYIPVLHQGYLKLFKTHHKKADRLFILGESFIKELSALHQEIRALRPEESKTLVGSLRLFKSVEILTPENISMVEGDDIILVDDELTRKFKEKYLKHKTVKLDTAFLRWDEQSVFSETDIHYDRISTDDFDRDVMRLTEREAEMSSDWWRQVGVVMVKDRKQLFKLHNQHVPSEHSPYIHGDPRDFVKAGERSELASAFHGEQMAIARAAHEGISLKSAHIYVTTFPCPVCAKLVAFSGIEKCFFKKGHASLDGEQVLKVKGVEIILVK